MTGQRSVTPHTHTLYDWTAVSYTHTHTHCMTGQRSVTPHTHTLYDWTAVSYTHTHTLYDGAVRPVLGNQTGRPAVDKHTLYDWTAVSYTTHTHCMMEQCGRYWAIRLADLQWTNTHCTTGQRSVTPHTHTLYDWTAVSYTHTHTLYDGAVRPVLGNQTGRPAVDKHTLYDWTAVSYTTHTHTV